jgi:hypothetical protein
VTGRRKPRVPCPVDGCGAPMIEDRCMCDGCFQALPAPVRKAALARWRAFRAFLAPRSNSLRSNLTEGELIHADAAWSRNRRCCELIVAKAGRVRRARGLAPEDAMTHELRDIGLI